jgi:hypothetical protein
MTRKNITMILTLIEIKKMWCYAYIRFGDSDLMMKIPSIPIIWEEQNYNLFEVINKGC